MDTSEMTAEWDIASAIDSLSTAREGVKLTRQELKENKTRNICLNFSSEQR